MGGSGGGQARGARRPPLPSNPTPALPTPHLFRFYRKTPASCAVKLTISYEVPDVLAPFASALTPLVERVLAADLGRFAALAEGGRG